MWCGIYWITLSHSKRQQAADCTVWFHNESALTALLSDFIIVLCLLHHLQAWGQLFLVISAVPERLMTHGFEHLFPALISQDASHNPRSESLSHTLCTVPLYTICFTFWLHVWVVIRKSNSTINSLYESSLRFPSFHFCRSAGSFSSTALCDCGGKEAILYVSSSVASFAKPEALWAPIEVKTISTVHESVVLQTGFQQSHSNDSRHDQCFPQMAAQCYQLQRKCLIDTWDICKPASCCLWHHTALYSKENCHRRQRGSVFLNTSW